MEKLIKKINISLLLILILVGITPASLISGSDAKALTIINLEDVPIGSKLVDSLSWEHKEEESYRGVGVDKPMEWLIVAKDHYGEDQVTLIYKELIGKQAFDTQDSIGNNNWGSSNTLRPWLNNDFYDSFSSEFKLSMVDTDVPNMTYNGIEYVTNDKVFVPSLTELGLSNDDLSDIGDSYEYFKSNKERIAKLGKKECFYWTRSPLEESTSSTNYIRSNGELGAYYSFYGNLAIRPVVNLESDTKVAHIKDDIYEIIETSNKDLKLATVAIEIAEDIREEHYIENAIEVVEELKESPDKIILKERIKDIEDVDNRLINFEFKNMETDQRQARVLKREFYPSQTMINIENLSSEGNKRTLQLEPRTPGQDNSINNSENLRKFARRKVKQAEKIRSIELIAEAEDIVSQLDSGRVKTILLEKLKKIED